MYYLGEAFSHFLSGPVCAQPDFEPLLVRLPAEGLLSSVAVVGVQERHAQRTRQDLDVVTCCLSSLLRSSH